MSGLLLLHTTRDYISNTVSRAVVLRISYTESKVNLNLLYSEQTSIFYCENATPFTQQLEKSEWNDIVMNKRPVSRARAWASLRLIISDPEKRNKVRLPSAVDCLEVNIRRKPPNSRTVAMRNLSQYLIPARTRCPDQISVRFGV